jgi:hypothetical protein
LALPFAATLSSAPAQAGCETMFLPGSPSYQQCLQGNTVANSSVPPCKQGGQICVDCTSALQNAGVTDPKALMQSGFDCASPGASPLMTSTPHCAVVGPNGPISTNQIPCSGTIMADPDHKGEAKVINSS